MGAIFSSNTKKNYQNELTLENQGINLDQLN
jgi:hypothetical protein